MSGRKFYTTCGFLLKYFSRAKTEEAPLVIPLLDNRKTSAALASLQKRREVLDGTEQNEVSEEVKPQEIPSNKDDSLESKAVRELLAQSNQVQEEESSSLVLPLKSDELPLDGAKESSMDDYDNIPINQFGLAMLRGMGWKEDPNKKKGPKDLDSPFVRPKGMGLGADKAIKAKPLLVAPENNEVLEIKKNAYVKVLAGKHQDLYGQIEGLDDHAGRVIVKMALGGTKESFNEFLLQPVPKKEFQQYGKVINAEKYDKYKKMENEFGQIKVEKLKGELKKEIKSEEKWDHDKYEDHRSKHNDRNNEDRKSKRDDRDNEERRSKPDHQDDEDRRYKRDDYKYKRDDEDRRSRKDGRDDRNQRSKREDRYYEDQRYKHDRKDNDSYRSKKDDREKRYDDRYDSRDDYRSKRDEKYEKNGDKRDDNSSRRNDYSDNKNRKDDKYSHKEESRSERRRSSSQETHKSSKHKSKKSSKHYSSDSDDDYRRSSKKKSNKKYDSDSSENDYSRSKKSSKSKRQRSRSRSRGRR